MAAVNFTGKWVEGESDNKEAMLRTLGLPEEQLPMIVAMKMGLEIIHEGDTFTMKEFAPDGTETSCNTFSIGEPFIPKMEEGGPSMGEMVASYTNGGKVLHVQNTGGKEYIDDTCMEPNGDLKVVQKSGDVTNTTIWKKM